MVSVDGRRATIHWRKAQQLQILHPAVTVDPEVRYVDDGAISTSAGVAAGIDLCLHLVRKDYGTEAANRIARRMVVAPHREGGRAQFIERPVAGPLAQFGTTCTWARQHLAEPLFVGGTRRWVGSQHLVERATINLNLQVKEDKMKS
jgi:transcriptional regulator GlxA family with amidase domain